jgi:RNA polymerase sigma-70 factor (ECF subfamily)
MPVMQKDPRVEAFLQGDQEAGATLLLELLPRIRNITRSLLGGDSDVDDIAQQVMIEVIRSLASYRNTGSLSHWTDRITVRVALHHARRARARAAREQAVGDSLENMGTEEVGPTDLFSAPPNPEVYAVRRATVDLLDRLPVEQRNAIVLHHMLGMSVGEAATEVGVSIETLRSRMRLGLQKLRLWSLEWKEAAL